MGGAQFCGLRVRFAHFGFLCVSKKFVQLYPNRPSGQLSRRTPTVIVSREARTKAQPRLRSRYTFPTVG